jgi:hypothetical protein
MAEPDYKPEAAGSAHAGVAGHVREATTLRSLLSARPELAGLLLADCNCGAEYTVPEGGDELGALEEAHWRHASAPRGTLS